MLLSRPGTRTNKSMRIREGEEHLDDTTRRVSVDGW